MKKPSTGETVLQPGGTQGKNIAEPARIKYLRIALLLVGRDVYLRNLHTHACLAVWLVVAHGPHSALSPDDSECLCDAGDLSVDCQPQTSRKLEPHLVHGMVQRGTRCSHGSAGSGEPRAHRAPLGRRPGTISCGRCPCVSDAARCGSRSPLVDDECFCVGSGV